MLDSEYWIVKKSGEVRGEDRGGKRERGDGSRLKEDEKKGGEEESGNKAINRIETYYLSARVFLGGLRAACRIP